MKLGNGDVSFRLGSITPSKVYLGSVEVSSAASPPSPPVGLVATMSPGSGYGIATSWGPPLAAEPAVTDYEVRFTPEGWNEAFVGTYQALTGGALEYLIDLDAMQAGVEWEIRVRAINAVGSSEWSESVYITVAIPPAAILGVSATTSETAESAADISWTEPDNGGAAITGYNIYTSEDLGATWTLHDTAASSPYELVLPYRGGNSVYVDVRAENSSGEGPSAALPGNATLSDSVPGPLTITGVTQQPGADLYVAWTEPEYLVTPAVSEYEIEYDSAGMAQFATTANLGNYTLSLGTMNIGQEFAIRVRAANSLGYGPWSEVFTQTVADIPSTVSPFFSQSMFEPGAIDISLSAADANGSPLQSYDIQVDLDGTFSSLIVDETYTDIAEGGASWAKTISGLAGNVTHYVRVRFTNAVGNAEWSSAVSGTSSASVPGQVQDFSSSINYEFVEWEWTWTPPNDGGSEITGYELQESAYDNEWLAETGMLTYYPGGGSTSSYAGVAITVADSTRYFRIRAINTYGSGEWSEYVSSLYDTPTVPGAPTINTATYNGYSTYITYSPPGDDGNSTITAYTFYFDGVAVSPDSTGAGNATFNSDYTGQDATMTATNSVGEGDASAAVEVTAI